MSVIEGLSHIVLATSSIEKYESCIQFYSQFGFETVVNSKIATSEPSKYLTQEKWLHLFGKPPVHDITLKLVLVANAIKKVPTSEEKDWRLEQASVASVTKDIVAVESILKSINAKYQKYAYSDVNETDLLATTTPANLVHTEIYTHDPLDNLIVFTNKPNPFSKSIYPIKPKSPVKKEIIESGLKILPQGTKMRIGGLTSGGDSPGMNAAVRSIVRVAISRGCEAYAIFEGYKGLVNGGDMIKKFGWGDVRGYLAIGGTLIGTARCAAFRERKGRLSSAYNLIKNKINSLIVCGGDGSLTGANALREEWPGLLSELIEEGITL